MSNLGMGRKLAGVGFVVFAAAIAMASVSSEAAARHLKHVAHHRTLSLEAQDAQASMNDSSHLGAMRYYGGPKSPMWREVR
jgi:hypothetical protein